MNSEILKVMLAMGTPPQSGQQQAPQAQMIQMVTMLALMGVVFYFLLIRPQQKKAKQLTAMLKAIKPGDKIVTTGGIIGVVITVKEKTLSIRSADAKLEITKGAVGEVIERGGDSAES